MVCHFTSTKMAVFKMKKNKWEDGLMGLVCIAETIIKCSQYRKKIHFPTKLSSYCHVIHMSTQIAVECLLHDSFFFRIGLQRKKSNVHPSLMATKK